MFKAFVLVSVLLIVQSAKAEESNSNSAKIPWSQGEVQSSGVQLIPTVGVAIMGIKTDSGSVSNDSGLTVGSFVDFGSGEFSFETGLLYNQFGAKQNSVKINLNYLSVPLVGKFNFSGNPNQSVFLKLGLMPGLLVDQEAKVGSRSISGSDVGAKSFDLPLVFGLGGSIPINEKMSVILEANYIRSLFNIDGKDGSDTARNEGFSVTTGLSLAL